LIAGYGFPSVSPSQIVQCYQDHQQAIGVPLDTPIRD
jgi:hypothetical protein